MALIQPIPGVEVRISTRSPYPSLFESSFSRFVCFSICANWKSNSFSKV